MTTQNKKIRLSDIAKAAGVSAATVSYVLNPGRNKVKLAEKTVTNIRRIADEMNYSPDISAQMLMGRRSRIIGIIIDSYAPWTRFQVLAKCEELLAQEGYRIMTGQAHDNPAASEQYFQDFNSYKVDAIICFAHEYPGMNMPMLERMNRSGKVVFVGKPAISGARYVDIDIEQGIRSLTSHLYETGRRKIALVVPRQVYESQKARVRGFRTGDFPGLERAVFELDICGDPQAVGRCAGTLCESGFDAVIANNDWAACMLLNKLQDKGMKVPSDIALAGFDNIAVSGLVRPALTTIDSNSQAQAEAIVKMTLDGIGGEQSPKHKTLETTLIIRGSTGRK